MSKWILPFEDIGRTGVSVAGGKGANLGELVGKGFPVPPGFVVSAEACQSFFRDINLHQEIAQFSNTHPAGKQVMFANFSSLRYFLSLGISVSLLA